ncbi:MAG TPA: hypothetical protein RMH99_01085 [Sandaracinaceae bacterium LLY-WYZ-13_1]|nr:hypothetical protein [Sandaracinaceae bacterium LLY-WYZ-13_1]
MSPELPARGTPPESAVERALRADPGGAGARAFEHCLVAAWVDFDRASLEKWAALGRRVEPRVAPVERRVTLAEALLAYFEGGPDEAASRGSELAESAAGANDETMVLLAACVRALAALGRRETDRATELARRASRMARTEGLLPEEYVANLVLARARRHAGRPHLAVRITTALALVVPPSFHRWVAWEACLAGEPLRRDGELAALVDEASAGARERLDARRSALEDRVATCAPMRAELAALVGMLDPRCAATEPVAPWRRGASSEAPLGIRVPADPTRAAAFVFGREDGEPGPRLAQAGLGLLPPVRSFERGGQQKHRVHTALAALASRGGAGMTAEALFEAVYGFAPVPVKHDGVFRVLLHRTRKSLGDAGTIDGGDGRLTLRLRIPIVVADSRYRRPLSEHVLSLVGAGRRGMTAREIARHLELPLRSVQTVLGELVDDGACLAERDGRRVTYVVEDTTFHEPTLHRLIPSVRSDRGGSDTHG